MILTEAEIVARVETLTVERLKGWVAVGLVRPASQEGRPVFAEIDVARVELLCALEDELEFDAETLPVLLSLVDQVHGLRRELRNLSAAVDAQPQAVRDEIKSRFRRLCEEE